MYFIIRTISKTDYIIKVEENKQDIIDFDELITNIMSSKIYNFKDKNNYEYYINTQHIEGFKIVE